MLSPIKSFLILFFGFLSIFFINYFIIIYKKQKISKKKIMNNSMGTILIIFGLLKIINLTKFVSIFQKYDIISKKFTIYAYIYPFIEILFGLSLIFNFSLIKVNKSIIILMLISILSVSLSLIKGQKLRCGCLGSFFHIPLSYVTLSENIVMLIMSSYNLNALI